MKKTLMILMVAVLVLSLAIPAFAGSISGRVYDKATGKGIKDAVVRIRMGSSPWTIIKEVSTVRTGNYVALNILNGYYELVVVPDTLDSYSSYRAQHVTIDDANKNARNIDFPISGLEFQPVP